VASWIPVSRAGEVGRGRWLGRDGEVRDSFEAHRGGEAHWRGLSAVARGSAEGLIVARPEEQQVALVVRLEGTGASFLSIEGAPTVAVPDDTRRLACAAVACGERID
jgi:hypothetical protein